MSDLWSYTHFFADRLTDSAKAFHTAVDAIGVLGYSARHPLEVTSWDGHELREIEFTNFSAAGSFLYQEGGLLNFLRPCESCEDSWELSIHLSFKPGFKTIEISSLLGIHNEDWDRIELAHDLRRLWHILANRLKPLYGYGARETQYEVAFSKGNIIGATDIENASEIFYQKIAEFKTPPVIFGQNYFDAFYYDQLNESVFSEIHHRKYILPEEYVGIYLSEFPWDSRVAALGEDGVYHLI